MKFIWDLLLVLAVVAMGFSGYYLYGINNSKTEYWDTYNNEIIGTDEDLQQKTITLENNLVGRSEYKFKVREMPTDLARVIAFDDNEFSGFYGASNIRFSAGIMGEFPRTIAHYKDQTFTLTIGDSLAGGVVEQIEATSVTFSKEGEIYEYPLVPKLDQINDNRNK